MILVRLLSTRGPCRSHWGADRNEPWGRRIPQGHRARTQEGQTPAQACLLPEHWPLPPAPHRAPRGDPNSVVIFFSLGLAGTGVRKGPPRSSPKKSLPSMLALRITRFNSDLLNASLSAEYS